MKRYLPLLAILVLVGALTAQVATAAAASPSGSGPVVGPYALGLEDLELDDEGEEETEEDELELVECGAEDFGFELDAEEEDEEGFAQAEEEELEEEEECDDAQKNLKGSQFVTAPSACKVSRAESKLTTSPAADEVRLTVRYRAWAPTPVTVALKLRDHKGSLGIGRSVETLRAHGVLHVTTKLGDAAMDRAMKASEFDVSLLAPKTPRFCAGALRQRLLSSAPATASSRRVYSSRARG